jgi:hypothetical protein
MRPHLAPAFRRPLAPLALVLVIAAPLVAHASPGALDGLVYLLPALLLGLTLAIRGYPGERALAALTGRRRERRTRGAKTSTPTTGAAPRALLPRGGRLIAASLAVRPPPRAFGAHS